MNTIDKFKELREEVEKLNERKVRTEANIEAYKKQTEEITKEILKLTGTKTIKEAKDKLEAIRKQLDKLEVEVEQVLDEVDTYERLNK